MYSSCWLHLLRSPKPNLLDILPPEIFDAHDTKRSPSNDINVGSAKAYRKSSGPEQHIPLPACVEVPLPHMQPSATPEIFSSS